MLTAHVDRHARYDFTTDLTAGWRLIFFRSDMLKASGGVEPLWYPVCGDERAFRAMIRWVEVRRSEWQAWGQLADEIGRPAFAAHMHALIGREPLEEVQGTVFEWDEDPEVLAVGELLSGPLGVRTEILHRHRFPSAAARERFYRWLFKGRNVDRGVSLLLLALTEGTAAMGAELDRLASEKVRGRPAPARAPRGSGTSRGSGTFRTRARASL